MNSREIEHCIDKYGKDIYRFCYFLTNNKDKADDLYQETFLKSLEINNDIRVRDTKNYLIGIASNIWRNQYRKEKRWQKIFSKEEYDEAGISSEDNMLDLLIEDETSKMVMSIVNSISEKYRIVILMYYSGEMSTSEIAESLNISKGTVTSRLKRGREIIKKSLEEKEYER